MRGLTELMEVLGMFWDVSTLKVAKEVIDRILKEANRMSNLEVKAND